MTAEDVRHPTDIDDEREQFIPVRKSDILDALVDHGQLASDAEREKFRQVCRILGAIYHYEYFELLEKLRRDALNFNPPLERHARLQARRQRRGHTELSAGVYGRPNADKF